MSPAALYVHFPSKAALLYEISRRGHELTLEMMEDAVARYDEPVERMRSLVEDFIAWHAERHTVARVIQYELAALPEDGYRVVAGLRRRADQMVRDVIAEGVTSGAFKVSDVRTASRAVLSLGIDVARWYNDRCAIEPNELGREYGELALRMLGATAA
jgi:AcrR family transcriptional regulator